MSEVERVRLLGVLTTSIANDIKFKNGDDPIMAHIAVHRESFHRAYFECLSKPITEESYREFSSTCYKLDDAASVCAEDYYTLIKLKISLAIFSLNAYL